MTVNGETADLKWWEDRLKDSTVSPLTRDYPEASDTNARRPIDGVESATSEPGLRSLLEGKDATPWSHFLLTCFVVLVARLTGDEDISVGTNAGISGPAFVLRVSVSASQDFASLLKAVSQAIAQSEAHPVATRALKSCLKTSALFRFAAFESSSSASTLTSVDDAADISLHYMVTGNGSLRLQAMYNQRLFSSARIAGILAQLLQLCGKAADDRSQAIGSIEFVTPQQRDLLPDPTSDLEWSSFRGPIHDIFAANAVAHPERICVVETKSVATPERVFTYKQINEASNIVAHHLVQAGIERGDVVMIYSYRGVDLVVAVMGVLKAGATFSVLDPQYPPDRQNIYLEVSQPKALVVIHKATEDAGPLSDKVREFVDTNLELRTEIPALQLRDGGVITGGTIGNEDIFAKVADRGATGPGIVVGPDSTPTLSFTSGSEGRPKGVRGRHYSLAFYFDWMAKTFNLSEDDKFTMLSGIAHDPIQRDMFTPLFLGAQLLVPAKDDIQNEKLAVWMKAYGATVTHLTPAMGQILVGGATARFDKLHHAFFVGDILIKRDCRSLQNLAPNVFIVNMYGTTETQRAVSYFKIPSFNTSEGFLDGMKDVIPAGRGMYNVQLLVVNRFDRTKVCAVGEVGEIYVRASGLAEGYLGTPELTEKKFVQNWFPGRETGLEADRRRWQHLKDEPWAQFYSGPRDRLYRSGDLGRYTPTGDVECSGRADDQVKIRGFRIELGEIDTHLSQHSLIRENVTLVRRDKFEEQTLVSYIVPQEAEWQAFLASKDVKDPGDDGSLGSRFQRFQLLRQDVQARLRGKLPAYAVPSLIVPMKRMPLNPNGKIDKPKLPFPDTAMLTAARQRRPSTTMQLSDTEIALTQTWSNLIAGIKASDIRPNESFFDLGGNSFTAQQLPFHIRRTKGVDININTIYNRPTLGSMAAYIDSLGDDSTERGGPTAGHVMNGVRHDEVNGGTHIGYAHDAETLVHRLPAQFQSRSSIDRSVSQVFLTGATGYLGAYILRDLLRRQSPQIKRVITLVRAKSANQAMSRLIATCKAYGVWEDAWQERVSCVVGNLGSPQLGLSEEQWQHVAHEVDVVIHNGAYVHWIQPYEGLKSSNVLGTIDAMQLCAVGKPKMFTFVSSTSVLDTDSFVQKSETIIAAGGEGIEESDDLSDSRTTLTTGYGQSKWVAEYLVRAAGQRGLRGNIIRPGYVLGDSESGVTNTDDFLVRMLKGCVQLRCRPNINNTVNMVPVDHVARVVVACAFNPPPTGVHVAQVTGYPRLRLNQFLATLQTYGYNVPLCDYIPWTRSLEDFVAQSRSESHFALMALFTFVMNDLPTNTRAPELDGTNTETALYADRKWTGEDVSAGKGVTKNVVGLYIAYLVAIGFLPPPNVDDGVATVTKMLPDVHIAEEQRRSLLSVGGRGTLV